MEKGRWEYTAISGDFVPGEAKWGSFKKKSQEGAGRERERGVRAKSPSPNIPGEGFDWFLSESVAILAGSGVQEAASPDFQQMGQ